MNQDICNETSDFLSNMVARTDSLREFLVIDWNFGGEEVAVKEPLMYCSMSAEMHYGYEKNDGRRLRLDLQGNVVEV